MKYIIVDTIVYDAPNIQTRLPTNSDPMNMVKYDNKLYDEKLRNKLTLDAINVNIIVMPMSLPAMNQLLVPKP